ncbi:Penicillin amidase [compost metagenome]
MIIDVGAWDNSLFVNNPGQSGSPLSRHYSDLLENWHEGKYVPLVYSKERIDDATVMRIMLSAG